MIGYVVLLISFPVQMTSWLPPHEIAVNIPGFIDANTGYFQRAYRQWW
ncbi:electron transport complex protein [Escherichia coli]|uniref:Electron transport complex protein n=1 Tax=Escherichia coli TaxID=562 RepID=A0A377CHQ3_ECOLX|nr:electron transport complex protein [Escherichia coli]